MQVKVGDEGRLAQGRRDDARAVTIGCAAKGDKDDHLRGEDNGQYDRAE